ncbi:MAG: peptidylprolyl isomerase [Wenzhouxiangella sp.]|nr:peptidylprolyl isomerase [Wenzhouxiangella sp.]
MKPSSLMVIAMTSVLLAGCSEEPAQKADSLVAPDDVILVEVDGEPISLPMLEFMMAQRGITEDDHDAMRALLDELIRLRAVANAAERDGLAALPEVRAQRALRDMETLQLHYFTQVHEENPVTDEAVAEVYNAQLQRSGDRQYRLQTVVYPQQADALLQLAALEDGQIDFDQVVADAREQGLTVEPTGWVDRSQLGPEIGPLITQVTEGEFLPAPLSTPQGWRLLRVEESRPLDVPSLDEVREGIERQLVRQRLEALVEDLYEAAEITPMLPLDEVSQ